MRVFNFLAVFIIAMMITYVFVFVFVPGLAWYQKALAFAFIFAATAIFWKNVKM